MYRTPIKGLAGGLCLAMLFWGAALGAEQREFLAIGDLHFNPYHALDAQQFATLRQTPIHEWRQFFDELKQPIVLLGSDSNYSLLASSLDAAKEQIESPAFILFGGDFLSHDWQSHYNSLAAESITTNPQVYQDFTIKTIDFVAGEFRKRFPKAVVHATLGNDDAFCQDYWIQADGAFLRRFADAWKPMLGTSVDAAAFDRSFSSLGCYMAELAGLDDHCLIVMNSVLWSKSYCCAYHEPGKSNCCDCTDAALAPGNRALAWLEESLSQAKAEKKRVWLLLHVPPGLDSYEEEEADGRSAAASLWMKPLLARYLELVGRYRSILQIAFSGHTHMDDYRLTGVDGKPAFLHKIVPSVSPVFGNNPAFQVYQFETAAGAVTDWRTYFLDLATSGHSSHQQEWAREYTALAAYRLTAINSQTIGALFEQIRDNPSGPQAQNYSRFFRAGAKPVPAANLPIYVCAILTPVYTEYSACVSAHNLPVPRRTENAAKLRRHAGGLGDPKR